MGSSFENAGWIPDLSTPAFAEATAGKQNDRNIKRSTNGDVRLTDL